MIPYSTHQAKTCHSTTRFGLAGKTLSFVSPHTVLDISRRGDTRLIPVQTGPDSNSSQINRNKPTNLLTHSENLKSTTSFAPIAGSS